MQALILAAGKGSRLGKFTSDRTKCMVNVAGKPLISHAINALKMAGIRKLVVVIGYQGNRLRDFLGDRQGDVEIEYVTNSQYEHTNNIYSLFLARDHLLQDDTLLLESDLIYDRMLLREVVNDPRPNLVVVDNYQSWMDGTVVTLDSTTDDTIERFIPKREIDPSKLDEYHKTVNIYKFSQEFSCTTYVPFLEAFLSAVRQNEYYEQVLKVITSLDSGCLQAFPMDGKRWYEIDDPHDKIEAEKLFADEQTGADLKSPDLVHGGLWRYPDVTDFRYLVNPYFPTPDIVRRMSESLQTLLTQYPSGQEEQQQAASILFDLRPEHLVVGNGAAELIRGLANSVTGNIGIVYPTFNEYPECFEGRVIPLTTNPEHDFCYSREELLRLASRCDNLLVVNPDNPTGHFLQRSALLSLAHDLYGMGCRLIVDESFVDFSGRSNQSLMDEKLLEAFPELVVIKSLGKSYGVPGARLGILATSDLQLSESIRRYLPIWNICSFGEYFLQIAADYRSDFAATCQKVAEERSWLTRQLAEINFLRPLPSAANFICCEVTADFTACELTNTLLNSHRILIKDLSCKTGVQHRQFVRVAVRDRVDNEALTSALASLDRPFKSVLHRENEVLAVSASS